VRRLIRNERQHRRRKRIRDKKNSSSLVDYSSAPLRGEGGGRSERCRAISKGGSTNEKGREIESRGRRWKGKKFPFGGTYSGVIFHNIKVWRSRADDGSQEVQNRSKGGLWRKRRDEGRWLPRQKERAWNLGFTSFMILWEEPS